MADDGSVPSNSIWPLPSFSFQVDWDGNSMTFQEVSGLNTETQVIEYRHANSPKFSTVKMPGLKKYGNVTMKKGIFKSDHKFSNWYDQFEMNTIKRGPVTISLLDETDAAAMVWTLTNAWPVKITVTDLKSEGDEVAIESIEFAHVGITIANA
jgi:phage tail-like protein